MSSSDFRQIAIKGEAGKAERLFRAAVSAFCALTRPSRREIAQLDDLTLPLFDMVSRESRRFVAAALSECEHAPRGLIKRLCDETVDIAAPLLIRSKALSDVDLIALIGRHGLSHARAIAHKPGLNPAIAHLVRALDRPAPVRSQPATQGAAGNYADGAKSSQFEPVPEKSVDDARNRLRSMMRPARAGDEAQAMPTADAYTKLRGAALTGDAVLFQTALADALDIDFPTARSVTRSSSYSALLAALRALDLSEERAFLVTAAVLPAQFAHREAISLFLERYRSLGRATALERIHGWKAEADTLPTGNAQKSAAPNGAAAARLRVS